ncbi:phosphatidylserine decarboxylase 1 [Yamadazyma tenuis]|uniref:Phosphatidylserine decarboxylase proenzyme 1, mitochondrial n=1 Tax=Candida tenuis (strain ATCC 10573 / BCRC 21748 / CBS 615 / JCM 9827 / NBRC 10315 / NRRL Y-1498 / VKM Y-70) TaxID=590646 RepID=G3B4B9_CANTC|nr:phosphatidylserine decarboxylase [Yamadazyma tenuis ATCC 10573]EGV63945.1 phosphatidylserine decarboxylase [Yamadazyma tenuis ATCC 10573]WEJ96440.1 phosphatidylserine decarboxylase 1 [Yamadazyma tenuis]
MAFRPPSFNPSPTMKQRLRYTPAPFMLGPQRMNIAQPLSRASTIAELASNNSLPKNNRKNKFKKKVASYYDQFPRIPRPKRNNVLFYSSWSNSENNKSHRFPNIRLSKRSFSTANQKLRNKTFNLHKRLFSAEARKQRQQRRRFIRWWTLTSLAVLLTGVAGKIKYERGQYDDDDEHIPHNEYAIKPESWQLYIYSTLPLKAISRLWGQVNSINLPVWLRSPSYRLYSTLFGVNLDEMENPDLTSYSNLSDFFYRTLKPGARPIDDFDLVSPSDGKVLKFGVIEDGEIEQVKGMTYSVDALLGLKTEKLAAPSHSLDFEHLDDDATVLERDQEFAKINGITYTVDDILGGESDRTTHKNDLQYKDAGDRADADSKATLKKELLVARDLTPTPLERLGLSGSKQLYFTVIYLAPGDYHRYHSPTNWVATLRRHFIGELFSVAPFFQKTLQGLFVLNERVALLGYWKYGFFSMIPVGATNVGSIVVDFDKDLKTNDIYEHAVYSKSRQSSVDSISSADENTPLIPEKEPELDVQESTSDLTLVSESSQASTPKAEKPKRLKKNTVYEATYTKASRLLGGYPMNKGSQIGGFKLGSTVVLVFEAPDNFKFDLQIGQKVKVGQSLGRFV